jgi:hypothetical protein
VCVPGLLRDIPFSAVYFPLCVTLKTQLPFWVAPLHMPEGATCTAAALLAGVVAAFTTTPLDMIKTRVQTRVQASVTESRPVARPARSASQATFVVAFSDEAGDAGTGTGPGPEADASRAMVVPSVGAIVQDLVEHEGVGALFRGVGPRVTRLAPCMTMTLFLYEHLHKLLD